MVICSSISSSGMGEFCRKVKKVGSTAPDFTLRAHDGSEVTLSTLRGKRVVLAFFAWAFSNT